MSGEPIVLLRRQSPAWRELSADRRRGVPIDPARYIPDHDVPGFPTNIAELISAWNNRFRIDFFTFRWILAELSRNNLAAVQGTRRFDYTQLSAVADLAATTPFYAYFHDDDDFFAPYAGSVTSALSGTPDAIVTPLFRASTYTFTFVRDGAEAEFIWGPRRAFDFRFQSNNYGIHSRRCDTIEKVKALADHILASQQAHREGYSEELLPIIVSATVKTPASASVLPVIMDDEKTLITLFEGFIARFAMPHLPARYRWISQPLQQIAQLVASVYRGDGYDAIATLAKAWAVAEIA